MSEIKSAIEIALEKTKEVVGNKDILEEEKYRTEGKKLVSRFLSDESVNLSASLKEYDRKKIGWVRDGIRVILQANLVLPHDTLGLKALKRVGEAFLSLVTNKGMMKKMLNQMDSFFEEYTAERERLVSTVEKQYAPRLKQKEEELAKKMGQPVKIDPHSDPEFTNFMRRALNQIDEQYGKVLEQAKGEINAMLERS